MSIPLACADFTFPLLEHERVLQLISMLGFQGVDIGLFEGRSHLQPSAEYRNPTRSGKKLAEKLRRHGLKPADIFLQTAPDFVSLAPNHPSKSKRRRARDLFLQTLDYAVACGARHVSALPGVSFPNEPADVSWRRCVEELAWRVARAQEAGRIFGVEVHIGSIGRNPADALRLVADVPGLTLTLDYTHFTLKGVPDKEVEPLLSHASHFHLRGAARNRLQTSFQKNKIDYRKVLTILKRGYKGYIGIEYVWIDWEHCNEVDNLSETILWRNFALKELK
jgi:sugar phosphate isomerase/epimerase